MGTAIGGGAIRMTRGASPTVSHNAVTGGYRRLVSDTCS